MDQEPGNIDVSSFLKHAPHEVVMRDVDPFAPVPPRGMTGWLLAHGGPFVPNVLAARIVLGIIATLILAAAIYISFFMKSAPALLEGADIQYPLGEPPRLGEVPLR